MATNTVTINSTLSYNMTGNVSDSKSGWGTASGGYASTWDAMALKFTPSAFSGDDYSISSINVSFNYRKSGSGTFYFYLLTSDPTSSSLNTIKSNNSSFASESWSGKASWQTKSLALSYTGKLKAKTTYYLLMCGTSSISEISGMSMSLTYSYWTNATANTPTITDYGDGTFSITASAGNAGTNNAVNSTTLKYKIGSAGWQNATGLSVATQRATSTASTVSTVVKAKTEVDGVHNDPTSGVDEKTIYNYLAPSLPGTVSLTKSKSRLTVRENWTLSWGTATQANTVSPVSGYRVRMYVKAKGTSTWYTTPIKNSAGNNRSGVGNYDGTDYYCDLSASTTSITIYPAKQPISFNSGARKLKAGDTIKFQIHAKATAGNTYPLWSYSNGTGRWSSEWPILNAGVVRVKVNNKNDATSWKEGVVWVKVNNKNDATSWKEADLVQVKTGASTWSTSN
jgi:hypothetical protein